MEKYKNLLQNIGVFVLANFAARILNFFILPLYTFYLSTEEYGTIDLFNTMLQLLYPIFTFAIADAVLRYGISNKYDLKEIFTIGLNTILLGFSCLTLGVFIAGIFFTDKRILFYFLLIFFVQAINSFFSAFVKALNKTKIMALITTFTGFLILTLNVLFIAILKKGINGYWSATIAGNIVGIVLYMFTCKLPAYYRTSKEQKVNKKLIKEMLAYSIPLIPNALFWWINSSLDRWVLTAVTGISTVGLYSCANKIPTILSTINTIVSQAWNLSLFQTDTDEERKKFYIDVFYYFNEIIFCCSIGIIMLSKVVGNYMFLNDFFEAWIYIPVLTMGLFYNSLNSFLGSIFTASKKTKYIFSTTIVGSVINMILNFPMVYLWEGIGAAVSTLISYLTVYYIRLNKIKSIYEISFDMKRICLQLFFITAEVIIVMNGMLWIPVIMVTIYCVKFIWISYSDIKKFMGQLKRY